MDEVTKVAMKAKVSKRAKERWEGLTAEQREEMRRARDWTVRGVETVFMVVAFLNEGMRMGSEGYGFRPRTTRGLQGGAGGQRDDGAEGDGPTDKAEQD